MEILETEEALKAAAVLDDPELTALVEQGELVAVVGEDEIVSFVSAVDVAEAE